MQIAGPSTPVPKQWGKYITNEKNKINLCDFLTHSVCKLASLPCSYRLQLKHSSLVGIGKKKAWNVLTQSNVHQEGLSLLGQDPLLDETTAAKCEAFICDLYPCPRKPAPTIANERRYVVFCQKKQKKEQLPPTSDSLRQHMQRTNDQTGVWRRSLTAMQILPSPEGYGWKMEDDFLQPVLMTKDPAPKCLLELTSCHL